MDSPTKETPCWMIAEFEPEAKGKPSSTAIICRNWLKANDPTQCYFPKTKDPYRLKTITEGYTVPTIDWPLHPVLRILKDGISSFSRARDLHKESCVNSDLDTSECEAVSPPKKMKTPPKKVTPKKNNPAQKQLKVIKEIEFLDMPVPPSSSKLIANKSNQSKTKNSDTKKFGKKLNDPKSNKSAGNEVNNSSEKNDTQSQVPPEEDSSRRNKDSYEVPPTRHSKSTQTSLLLMPDDYAVVLLRTVSTTLALVQQNPGNTTVTTAATTPQSVDNQETPRFVLLKPIEDIKDFWELNGKLSDLTLQDKLIEELLLVGHDEKKTKVINSMLDRILSPSVAAKFSWGGKRSSMKKAPKSKFSGTQICNVLLRAMRQMYGDANVPDNVFKTLMEGCLTQAPFKITTRIVKNVDSGDQEMVIGQQEVIVQEQLEVTGHEVPGLEVTGQQMQVTEPLHQKVTGLNHQEESGPNHQKENGPQNNNDQLHLDILSPSILS